MGLSIVTYLKVIFVLLCPNIKYGPLRIYDASMVFVT